MYRVHLLIDQASLHYTTGLSVMCMMSEKKGRNDGCRSAEANAESASPWSTCIELGTNTLLSLSCAVLYPYVVVIRIRVGLVWTSLLLATDFWTLSMASITGYCAVCREVFNAEERRPHCIPCGNHHCGSYHVRLSSQSTLF